MEKNHRTRKAIRPLMYRKWMLWLGLRYGRFADTSKLLRQKPLASHGALISEYTVVKLLFLH